MSCPLFLDLTFWPINSHCISCFPLRSAALPGFRLLVWPQPTSCSSSVCSRSKRCHRAAAVCTRDSQGVACVCRTRALFLQRHRTASKLDPRARPTAGQSLLQGLERSRQRSRVAFARVHAEHRGPHRRGRDGKDQVHANSHSGSRFPPRVPSYFSFR